MFVCTSCDRCFNRKDNLRRHQVGYCKPASRLCEVCGVVFSSRGHFQKHQSEKHGIRKKRVNRVEVTESKRARIDVQSSSKCNGLEEVTECCECGVNVSIKYLSQHKKSLKHKNKLSEVEGDGIALIKNAFKNRIATYRISTDDNKVHIDVKEFLLCLKQKTLECIRQGINKHRAVKVNTELFGVFTLPSKDIEEVKSFNTKFKNCEVSTDLDKTYASLMDEMDNKASEFQEKDSGWTIKELLFIELSVNKYNPLRASSYIKLPKPIEDKKALINIQNFDNKCFMWSVLAGLYPAKHNSVRVTNYKKYEKCLNFADIEFPMKLKDINRFEALNKISVNVYGIDSNLKNGSLNYEIVGPLHFTEKRRNQHVNLLLIDDDSGKLHYCLIQNLCRLVGSQLSKKEHRKYLCDGCLVYFSDESKLCAHIKYDCNHIRVRLPTRELRIDKFGDEVPSNILKFEGIEKKLRLPFVVYADFESLLIPIAYCQKDYRESFTEKTHIHQPYSFGYYVKCSYNESLSKYVSYRGRDCAEIFCKRIEDDVKAIYNNHLKHVVPMVELTESERVAFISSENCHICEKPFQPRDDRVHNHDHLTGRYLGPAHGVCNLNYKIPDFIPVFFHNLSNYDAHLFIKTLGVGGEEIDVIAENKEKYISFSKHVLMDTKETIKGEVQNKYLKLRFLDSFRFMPASLDRLAVNLNDNQCKAIKHYFPELDKFQLVRKKGVFPYSFVDSFNKLNYKQLPLREEFYNDLTRCHISEEDYAHAQTVWKTFNISSIGEYSDLYLKTDVLLLSDIFEAFRNVCQEIYDLDSASFFTTPGLSWAAMLKYTKVELELLTDIDMLHFIEKGIRGGVSQCSIRHLKANNKYMTTYDISKPTSFINYLDATNLYGKSLSALLPINSFKFLSPEEIIELDVLSIPEVSSKGYIYEVDLIYPKELHDNHNDFPFCPQNIIPPGSKQSKLIPNLNNKFKYIIHYRNLQQCLKAGLELHKIHRILSFNQSDWLKKYVDLNTKMRNIAVNEFEKMFYKLMNNSVFGKTMENVNKRTNVKLITHWENKGRRLGAEALVSKPHFKNHSVFSESLVAIQMEKLSVQYDKPVYIGFCVLELAKYVMYDFYYNFIKKTYGDNVKLAYTDTDSLIIHTYTDNFYDDIKNNLDKFDTSNFKDDNKFGIPKNESVIGRMKDEYCGKILWEFVGTGSKAYIIDVEGEFYKTAKGIQRAVIKNQLSMDDYKNVVFNGIDIYKNVRSFKSYRHELYTELQNKVALSWRDDKRYIIPGGCGNTLAWGHYKIPL